jgi:hypothetical protein
MTLVYFRSDRMELVPMQVVYVDGQHRPDIVCRMVTYDARGAKAILDPISKISDDDLRSLRRGVQVYATYTGVGFGPPIFRGFIGAPNTNLRNEAVELVARSPFSYLYDMSCNVQTDFLIDRGNTQTFALGNTQYLLERNIYKPHEYEVVVTQIQQIVDVFYQHVCDLWWRDQVTFHVDPRLEPFLADTKTLHRFEYDAAFQPLDVDARRVTIKEKNIEFSPIGAQTFRNVYFGQVVNYILQRCPGLQVYEYFTENNTQLWFGYPSLNGSAVITVGYGNFDWVAIGADVVELAVQSDNEATYNRAACHAANASCAITIFSETDDGLGNQLGLIPDWPLFDPTQAPVAEDGVIGVGTFDYVIGLFTTPKSRYSIKSTLKQTVDAVLINEEIANINSELYMPGYDDVGRKWRLPNWFALANIENTGDIFQDLSTGETVDVQVFVEMAVEQTQEGETVRHYKYDWVPYRAGFSFNAKEKTLTLQIVPKTRYIIHELDEIGNPIFKLDETEDRYKLCRVALAFTYSHPLYALYGDTALDNGGVIEESKRTAIDTGETYHFERPDIGYSQMSNIDMPLKRQFFEKVPTTLAQAQAHKGLVYQEKAPSVDNVIYPSFLVTARVDGQHEAIKKYIAQPADPANDTRESSTVPYARNLGALAEPKVIRDESEEMWQVLYEVYDAVCKTPRSMQISLDGFSKAIARGTSIGIKNLRNHKFDDDVIDTVYHDLSTGQTKFRTTNRPSMNEVNSIIAVGANPTMSEDVIMTGFED